MSSTKVEAPDLHRSGGGSSTHPSSLLVSYRRTRDPATRARLVELYLPLVRSLARRHAHRGASVEDLVQVGSIGLLHAIDRFDPERSRDLPAFAVPTITGEIRHHLRDHGSLVRLPRRTLELAPRLRAAQARLATSLSRPPTLPELALEAGLRERDVLEVLEAEHARTTTSLADDLEVDARDSGEASIDRLTLAAGFRALGARERRILHLHYFAGLSQAEIADEVGLSQAQVSRLIRRSLARLRATLDEPRVSSEPSRAA